MTLSNNFRLILLIGLCASFHIGLYSQEGASAAQSERELAERIILRMQEIIASTDERLPVEAPLIDTLPGGRILELWFENEKAVKLAATEPDTEGSGRSVFYFVGEDLFFVSQPFSRFIFLKGQLAYWLDKDWQFMPANEALLDEREGLLYEEANQHLGWFYGNN